MSIEIELQSPWVDSIKVSTDKHAVPTMEIILEHHESDDPEHRALDQDALMRSGLRQLFDARVEIGGTVLGKLSDFLTDEQRREVESIIERGTKGHYAGHTDLLSLQWSSILSVFQEAMEEAGFSMNDLKQQMTLPLLVSSLAENERANALTIPNDVYHAVLGRLTQMIARDDREISRPEAQTEMTPVRLYGMEAIELGLAQLVEHKVIRADEKDYVLAEVNALVERTRNDIDIAKGGDKPARSPWEEWGAGS